MPSAQTVSILHRRHFFIFAFYFSITTVLSVSAGRSTRMICPLTRRKQPESSFVRFSNIFGNMADVVVHDRFAVMEIIIHNQT